MAKLTLIAGLIPYDSGKTWFVLGSALYARSLGLNVGVFKPVAGHSLWYSPRTIKRSIRFGLLLGNDITMYYESGLIDDPALSNPVAIATLPPDPCFYGNNVNEYMLDVDSLHSTAVISRITDCYRRSIKHYYYPENLKKSPPAVKETTTKLISVLQAEQSSIDDLVNYMESPSSEENLNNCLLLVQRGKNIVFIESFNDAITPYLSLLNKLDAIAIVAPGRVLVYRDVEAVQKVVLKHVEKHGWEGFRARHIVASITAEKTLSTGFATKPRPKSAHMEFVNEIL